VRQEYNIDKVNLPGPSLHHQQLDTDLAVSH